MFDLFDHLYFITKFDNFITLADLNCESSDLTELRLTYFQNPQNNVKEKLKRELKLVLEEYLKYEIYNKCTFDETKIYLDTILNFKLVEEDSNDSLQAKLNAPKI